MSWKPATRQEVLDAMAADLASTAPDVQARFAGMLIEPQPALVERFGHLEPVIIVARRDGLVVYFDDVEDNFWLGNDATGVISDTADYDHLGVALRELERQAALLTGCRNSTF